MTELRCKIPHICIFCKKKFKGFKKEFSNGNSLHLLMLSRIYIALFLLWFNFLRCDILNWHPPFLWYPGYLLISVVQSLYSLVFYYKYGKIFYKYVSFFQNNLCPWFVHVFVVHYKIRNLTAELREVGIIYGGVLNSSCF